MQYISKEKSIVNSIIKNNQKKSIAETTKIINTFRTNLSSKYISDVSTITNNVLKGSNPKKEVSKVMKKNKNTHVILGGRNYDLRKLMATQSRNAIKNIAVETSLGRLNEMGGDVIYISFHFDDRLRPKCEEDQDKYYSITNQNFQIELYGGEQVDVIAWNESSFGDADGILGINCRHQLSPVFFKKVI